jgi:hypothetical protein
MIILARKNASLFDAAQSRAVSMPRANGSTTALNNVIPAWTSPARSPMLKG